MHKPRKEVYRYDCIHFSMTFIKMRLYRIYFSKLYNTFANNINHYIKTVHLTICLHYTSIQRYRKLIKRNDGMIISIGEKITLQ